MEIKKSTVGKGSKVPHLSYIGDCTIGEGVNIGAGTYLHYDGKNKNATTIGDGSFIGSDTMLVAPSTSAAVARWAPAPPSPATCPTAPLRWSAPNKR